MGNKLRECLICIVLVLLIGFIGFIVGRKRVSLGEQITDTTELNLSLDGIKINQNPSDGDMLDVRVEIPDGSGNKEFIATAFEIYRLVDQKLSEDEISFDKMRIQVCSGHWQRDYVIFTGYSVKLDEKDISLKSFWADAVNLQTPETKMVNTMARPSAFRELAHALFVMMSVDSDTTADFKISNGKNLQINLYANDMDRLFEYVADVLIVSQVSAEQTNVFLDKVTVYAEVIASKERDKEREYSENLVIKFDYRYLDMLTDSRISTADFIEHVYISID